MGFFSLLFSWALFHLFPLWSLSFLSFCRTLFFPSFLEVKLSYWFEICLLNICIYHHEVGSELLLQSPIGLGILFPFSFVSRYILISLLISSLTHLLLGICFYRFVDLLTFLVLISNLLTLWSEIILCMISLFLNLPRLILWLSYSQSWRMFHVPQRWMYILLLLDGMFS